MQLGRAVGGVVERSQPKLNSSPFHLSSHPISPDPFFPPRSGQPAPPDVVVQPLEGRRWGRGCRGA